MLEIVAAAASVAVSAGGGVWYLSSRLTKLEQQVGEAHRIIKRELTPNGGDSLRDRVVRIETQLHAKRLNEFYPPEGTPDGF